MIQYYVKRLYSETTYKILSTRKFKENKFHKSLRLKIILLYLGGQIKQSNDVSAS